MPICAPRWCRPLSGRPGRGGPGQEPRSAWRKRHGCQRSHSGIELEAARLAQGEHAEGLPNRCHWQCGVGQTQPRRDGDRGKVHGCPGSIHRNHALGEHRSRIRDGRQGTRRGLGDAPDSSPRCQRAMDCRAFATTPVTYNFLAELVCRGRRSHGIWPVGPWSIRTNSRRDPGNLLADLEDFINNHRPSWPLDWRRHGACLERLSAHGGVPMWRGVRAARHPPSVERPANSQTWGWH